MVENKLPFVEEAPFHRPPMFSGVTTSFGSENENLY